MNTPPPPTSEIREQIARIVDPDALWGLRSIRSFLLGPRDTRRQERALAKADAILNLPRLKALLGEGA